MKRRWRYLLGAFLLAAGLLAGCTGEAVAPQETIQESQSQQVESLEVETAEESEAESPKAESQGETEAEAPEADTIEEAEAEDPETETIEETEAENPEIDTIEETEADSPEAEISEESEIREDGTYTSKEEVAEYIYLYGHLPDNFITKKEAKALGWVSSEGNLAEVAPGKSIGGDYFGNFEGNLPEKKGREYHECDIDSDGRYRGAKRLVFSNDGLIYYTEDHYNTFELLYGEE